jgi:hypothetical protein
MSEQFKSFIDAASLGVAGAAVLEYLPAAAAAASLIWTLGRMTSWACRQWRIRK